MKAEAPHAWRRGKRVAPGPGRQIGEERRVEHRDLRHAQAARGGDPLERNGVVQRRERHQLRQLAEDAVVDRDGRQEPLAAVDEPVRDCVRRERECGQGAANRRRGPALPRHGGGVEPVEAAGSRLVQGVLQGRASAVDHQDPHVASSWAGNPVLRIMG